MTSKENENVDALNILEDKSDNEAIKENYIISKLLDSVKRVAEKNDKNAEQEISITPVIQVDGDSSDKAGMELADAPIVQVSAELLPLSFKGFTPFRGFRKLDKAKIMELVSSTEELLKENAKFVDNKDVINENIKGVDVVDVTTKTVKGSENNDVVKKTVKIVGSSDVIQKSIKTEEDVNVSMKSLKVADSADTFKEVVQIQDNSFKMRKDLPNRNRKKKRKLAVRKRGRPLTSTKTESDIDPGAKLYKQIYQQCVDIAGNRKECNSMLKLTKGVSTDPTVEVDSVLNMAVETIDKLKKDELGMKKEISSHQQNQKKMLKKLIKLLRDNVPVKGKSDFEADISSEKIPVNQVLGTHLKKLKTDFYGFRSTNPRTRDRGGAITAERLFAESPPTSPVRGTRSLNTPSAGSSFQSLTLNNIQHLDFVFKPLSDFSCDSLSINEPSNEQNRDNKRVYNLKGRIVEGNTSAVRTGLSLRMKNSKRKVLNSNKSNKLSSRVKGVEQLYKSSQLEGKLGIKLKPLPRRGIKSLFARQSDASKLKSSNRRYSEEISDTHENSYSVRRLSTGSLRDSCGPFGAPKKSGAESAFGDISVSSSVHSKGGTHSSVTRGIKRKFDIADKNGCAVNDSKVLCITSDLKSLRSNRGTTTMASDIGSEVSGASKARRLSVAKVKPSAACNHINNSKANESINIISNQPLLNKGRAKNQSNDISTKLPMDNSKVSKLYYPVHPFISHDLPVHFIPIDANKVPPYLPLYCPEFNPNSAVPIYPSFIRTRPSTEQESPSKYILAKGISTRSIPHRSFSEDKVHQNLFQGIYSEDKCPLVPKIDRSLISQDQNPEIMVKSEESEHPKPTVSLKLTLSSNSTDALGPNMNSCNPNQKIHKCLQCDFVTPKLGVLKRHELTHAKGNPVQNGEMIHNLKISSSPRTLAMSHPGMNHLHSYAPVVMTNNNLGAANKKVDSQQKSIFKELNSFSGFPDSSPGSPFVNRLLSVSLSPLKRKTK